MQNGVVSEKAGAFKEIEAQQQGVKLQSEIF